MMLFSLFSARVTGLVCFFGILECALRGVSWLDVMGVICFWIGVWITAVHIAAFTGMSAIPWLASIVRRGSVHLSCIVA